MNSKVDFYFNKAKKWQDEITRLRAIALGCQLTEDLKWGCPCYTFNGSNVVLIHTFKNYCALLFFNGALLQDTEGILVQQTENVQAARQVRFTAMEDIDKTETAMKSYIYEAIEIEKAGLKVTLKKTADFIVADEFKARLNELPTLKAAFEALTPGRQKGYYLYFAAPKQAKTREARVEKSIPRILAGKGLDD